MSDYFSGGALADATLTFYKVKEEIERLRAENEQLKMTILDLQNSHIISDMNLNLATDMIKQLKAALRKCSPCLKKQAESVIYIYQPTKDVFDRIHAKPIVRGGKITGVFWYAIKDGKEFGLEQDSIVCVKNDFAEREVRNE